MPLGMKRKSESESEELMPGTNRSYCPSHYDYLKSHPLDCTLLLVASILMAQVTFSSQIYKGTS